MDGTQENNASTLDDEPTDLDEVAVQIEQLSQLDPAAAADQAAAVAEALSRALDREDR